MALMSRLLGRPLIAVGLAGGGAVLLPFWLSINTPLNRLQSGMLILSAAVYFAVRDWDIMDDDEPESGREEYSVGSLRSWWSARQSQQSDDPEVLPVDSIEKRDPDGEPYPRFDLDTSVFSLGMTGRGKSTFIKAIADRWRTQTSAVIVHSLADGDSNEFEDFYSTRARKIIRLSSRNSTHRWNPFDDYDRTMKNARSIASGMTGSIDSVDTGWSQAAESLLEAAILVTWHDSGDFADLPQVLNSDTEAIAEAVDDLDDRGVLSRQLQGDSMDKAHDYLLQELEPLLLSETFDKDLPTFSLTDYIAEPYGIVSLNHIAKDRYARPFWSYFLDSAIDISMEMLFPTRFVLDEFDKLPPIDHLDELASRGRTADSIGVLACQNRGQLMGTYGDDDGESIWSNTENKAMFAAGDVNTAEMSLQTLGRSEVTTSSRSGTDADETTSKSIQDSYPLTSAEIGNLDVGEALVNSKHGWWLVDLTEPEL